MATASPWSVKGIEPEAREAAKIAARRAGMTLGQWLSRTIHAAAAEQLAGPARASSGNGQLLPGGGRQIAAPAAARDAMERAIGRLAARLARKAPERPGAGR